MSNIYGALGVNQDDSQYSFVHTFGQVAIYEAVNQHLADFSAELDAAMGIFVERETDAHILKYMLPGGGRMQKLGPFGQAGATKASGSWSVGFPLDEYGDKLSASRVAYAYMTLPDLDRDMKSIEERNINTLRFAILKPLFNNASQAYTDPQWGALTVQCLANSDNTLYPPQLGTELDAASNHYLASGYISSNISNTNDPFPPIVRTLEQHFGIKTGGDRVVVFCNFAEKNSITLLTEFTTETNIFINPGADVNTVEGLPTNLPGRVLGVHESAGCIIVEWDFIPSGYLLAVHLGQPAPLIKRVDPAAVGLGRGLQLVAQSSVHPFTESHYSHRFGMGVGNRLNGVVMQLTTGSYTIPAAFA